ncbi:hypothetical protein EV702DRAFT_1281632 [Suillus placidus]|uniref:Uncharacterized protein n=1 Tax=Suillus placidus TaxID=48579 RepID=A0A9P6ZMM2_9AGAM|nr:hypothetical protein EV702DRAFT_1281632 [Suillus placidus]
MWTTQQFKAPAPHALSSTIYIELTNPSCYILPSTKTTPSHTLQTFLEPAILSPRPLATSTNSCPHHLSSSYCPNFLLGTLSGGGCKVSYNQPAPKITPPAALVLALWLQRRSGWPVRRRCQIHGGAHVPVIDDLCTTSDLFTALAFSPPSHSHHPRILTTLAFSPPSHTNSHHPRILTTLAFSPPSHSHHPRILTTLAFSPSSHSVPTSREPHHVPLPSIALADLKTQGSLHQGNTTRVSDGPSIVEDGSNTTLADSMGRDHAARRQPFTSIPLHAAHPFQTRADRSKEPCLEDLYICSYTPTLSALIRSRQMMKRRAIPSFVAIGQGQPGAGKGKALSAVDSALELVHKLVPATANRTTISGDATTRAGAPRLSWQAGPCATLRFPFRRERLNI